MYKNEFFLMTAAERRGSFKNPTHTLNLRRQLRNRLWIATKKKTKTNNWRELNNTKVNKISPKSTPNEWKMNAKRLHRIFKFA